MKVARTKHPSGVADRSIAWHGRRFRMHYVVYFIGMVKYRVQPVYVLVAKLTKRNSHEVVPADNSDEFLTANNWDMVNAVLLKDLPQL